MFQRKETQKCQTFHGAVTIKEGESNAIVRIHPAYESTVKPQIVATANAAVLVYVRRVDGESFELAITEAARCDVDISWVMTIGPRCPFGDPPANYYDENNPPHRKGEIRKMVDVDSWKSGVAARIEERFARSRSREE